jgi:hypothetical protein
MTASPHAQHIPVQGLGYTVDAILAPVSRLDSVDRVAGATALLPPYHPANTTQDSAVVRWTLRMEQARPVEEDSL